MYCRVQGGAGPGAEPDTDRSFRKMKIAWSYASHVRGRGFESYLQNEPMFAIGSTGEGLHLPSPTPIILAWNYKRSHRRSVHYNTVRGLSLLARRRRSTLDEVQRMKIGLKYTTIGDSVDTALLYCRHVTISIGGWPAA